MASANPQPPTEQLFTFVAVVSAICVLAAWIGLRAADAAKLPMPYLRRLDGVREDAKGGGFLPSVVFGCVFAAGAIFVLHFFHQPNLAGSLWSRMVSVFFAAGSLEIVIHLFVMSAVIRVARGRVWAGIVAAAIFFVAFHVAGLYGQNASLIAASVALNGVFGLALGFLYARYGFEYVLLCHAIAHLLAVSLA